RSLDGIGADDPIWDNIAWTLAQLCHTIVCTAAPFAIAFGGGVMERQPHLLDRIERLLIKSLNGYLVLPDNYIRRPGLGAMAGPLGSIALAIDAVG
ncbi:MAG: ROK family protein, partial [Sphingomicrobium sp.]